MSLRTIWKSVGYLVMILELYYFYCRTHSLLLVVLALQLVRRIGLEKEGHWHFGLSNQLASRRSTQVRRETMRERGREQEYW